MWTKQNIENMKEEIWCKTCGVKFIDYVRDHRKFCSPACAYKDKDRISHSQPKDRGTAICDSCKKEFKLVTNGGVKFCSRKCAGTSLGKTYGLLPSPPFEANPDKKLTLSCKACGAIFTRYKNMVRSQDSYCSKKCANSENGKKASESKRNSGFYAGTNLYSRAKRGWRTINGKKIHFRSRMEANYARYLTFIGKKWEYEPKTFWFDGIKRGVCSYVPDFYLPDEKKYVECKGWMDSRSKTKLRRMLKYHPSETVEVFDWKSYQALKKQLCKCIPEWEMDL